MSELYTDYHGQFEYFGNTEIERIRKQGGKTIRHDWIIFDTIDEIMEFFNVRCFDFAQIKLTNCYHIFIKFCYKILSWTISQIFNKSPVIFGSTKHMFVLVI